MTKLSPIKSSKTLAKVLARPAGACVPLALLVAGCAVSAEYENLADKTDLSSSEQATIGGIVVPPNGRTATELAVVQLRVPGASGAFCTATLLRPNWVLTAKHCAVQASGAARTDIVVVHDLGNSVPVPAANVRFHPNPSVDGALLNLPTPINVNQANITLFYGGDSEVVGKAVTAYGYGDSDGGVTPLTKIQSTIEYVENDRSMNGSDAFNRRYLRIAGSTAGDSGGPSFLNGQLVGVTGSSVNKLYSTAIRSWVNGIIAPSTSGLIGAATSYGSNMAPGVTVTMSGDVNGDKYADVIQFNQDSGPAGSVYVLLGTSPAGIGAMTRWHTSFSLSAELPAVGDVNGDGLDDIIKAVPSNGDVYVALSTGTTFGPSTKYHDTFLATDGRFAVGDMNGDARVDIVNFKSNGDVTVSLSCGKVAGVYPFWGDCVAPNTFGPTQILWRSGFSVPSTDQLRVGDVTGDDSADLVRFDQSSSKVYVAPTARLTCTTDAQCSVVGGTCATSLGYCWGSPGKSGGASAQWSGTSSRVGETPMLADLNGDGRADVANFETTTARGRDGYFTAQISTGSAFGILSTWSTNVCKSGRKCFVGDIGRDGRADLLVSGGGNVSAFFKRVTP